jgi:hypothetical protein
MEKCCDQIFAAEKSSEVRPECLSLATDIRGWQNPTCGRLMSEFVVKAWRLASFAVQDTTEAAVIIYARRSSKKAAVFMAEIFSAR